MNTTAKKQDILAAFRTRHAAKTFDPSRKISEDDFNFIMETARLSPSSLGYEPWKFLVVQNAELREEIRAVSFGAQGQLPTASHFVILLARNDARTYSDYVQQHMVEIQKVPPETWTRMSQAYHGFQQDGLKLFENDRALFDWAGKQTYIALGNMLTAAAQIGIDSCPIEGFDYERVNEILDREGLLENGAYGVSVMAAFGYRAQEPSRTKSRRDYDSVIQWVE